MRHFSLLALGLCLTLSSPLFATCLPPAISVSPANPSCGSPATLDAGAGWVSYHWTDSFGYDYGTSQTMTTDFSGTYTVEVTDANSCSTSATASVTVTDFTIARAPSAACPSQLIRNVEIVGAQGQYSWSLTHGTIVNNYGRSIDLTIDGTDTAVLTATVDDGGGCLASKSTSIAVAGPLTGATISAGATTICAGSSTPVTATPTGGSGSYTFVWYGDGAPINGSTGTITVSASGSYYAEVTDNYGCGSATTPAVQINVSQPAQPSISASGPATFCSGGSVTLTSSVATGYLWSTGATTQSITVSASGSYSVTTTDAYGCTSAASQPVSVTVSNRPSASVSGGGTICAGSSATISAALTGTAPFSLTWSDGFVQTTPGTSVSRVVSPSSTTNYTVTALSDATGCSGSASGNANVVVRVPPSATVSGSTTMCAGTSAAVSAAVTLTDYPVNITWSDGVVQQLTSGTTATRGVSPAATTTYSVTAISDSFCTGTSSGSAIITVETAPSITQQPASVTIKRNTTTTLSVSATSTRPIAYQWYQGASGNGTNPISGATGASYTTPRLQATTSYWVRVMNVCGPTNSSTAVVTVH